MDLTSLKLQKTHHVEKGKMQTLTRSC